MSEFDEGTLVRILGDAAAQKVEDFFLAPEIDYVSLSQRPVRPFALLGAQDRAYLIRMADRRSQAARVAVADHTRERGDYTAKAHEYRQRDRRIRDNEEWRK